jgi:hypothetical protein
MDDAGMEKERQRNDEPRVVPGRRSPIGTTQERPGTAVASRAAASKSSEAPSGWGYHGCKRASIGGSVAAWKRASSRMSDAEGFKYARERGARSGEQKARLCSRKIIDVSVLIPWAFVVMYAWMKARDMITPIRPTRERNCRVWMPVLTYPTFAPSVRQ